MYLYKRQPPQPSFKSLLFSTQVLPPLPPPPPLLLPLFSPLPLPLFPSPSPLLSFSFPLTDAHGEYVLEMRLINEEGGEFGRGQTPKVNIENPLATCEFALQVQNLQFPKPGQYEFQIFANGSFLATKNFRVREIRHGGTTNS